MEKHQSEKTNILFFRKSKNSIAEKGTGTQYYDDDE